VRIPAGVQDGQTIRVPGKGDAGSGGAAAGDLFLHVRFASHPEFRSHGADLYHELDLAPWEAVLGATIEVPTLEKPVTLRIPAGSTDGKKLRVRGQGLPSKNGQRGELFVVLNIETPAQLTDEERKAWEHLATVSKFSPRDN
jgi:curved DNA-binding protein